MLRSAAFFEMLDASNIEIPVPDIAFAAVGNGPTPDTAAEDYNLGV